MLVSGYGTPVARARLYLSGSYRDLSTTTSYLLGAAGTSRTAGKAAAANLTSLANADIAALNSGISTAGTKITATQAADAALTTVHEKLDSMRALAEDVALGNYNAKKVAAKDDEYQTLAGEVAALVADLDYDGKALSSLQLSSATEISLTNLPDGATGTIGLLMADVLLAQGTLRIEAASLADLQSDMQTQLEHMTGFASRLSTAKSAMEIWQSVTAQIATSWTTASTAHSGISSDAALSLLA